jgi:hypothetical protein
VTRAPDNPFKGGGCSLLAFNELPRRGRRQIQALGATCKSLESWPRWSEQLGEGPKAHAGRALGGEVVASLDKFRLDHGRYPTDLAELYPQYMKQQLKEVGRGDTEGISFHYIAQENDAFFLKFRYFGPGVNDCAYEYASKPETWSCSGHY